MSAPLQTIVALTVVALALAWLIRRALRSRKNPGCNCSGCPTGKLKPRHRD
ncbi:MAG: FeoB-associated Cys-rich membrane protein [Opitutae bacterium]|nr:FeoB-associated Cys-rich membrane protein [Opitutae bacterium]